MDVFLSEFCVLDTDDEEKDNPQSCETRVGEVGDLETMNKSKSVEELK